jgi:U3 small nucleolar RNA-associated protein 13
MSSNLKDANTGLSRSWKVSSSRTPFFSGGKAELIEGDSGDYLVCMHDENIKVVDWGTGETVLTLLKENDEDEVNDPIVSFTMHPTKFEMVVATSSGLIQHYAQNPDKEEKSFLLVRSIKAHTMPILTMCYDPTGTLVATGSTDHSVKVWDVEKGYCTHSFREHQEAVSFLRFHPDPNNLRLISAAHDSSIRVWDLIDSKCVASYREHLSLPTAVDWASDKYLMISVGRDKVSIQLLAATIIID